MNTMGLGLNSPLVSLFGFIYTCTNVMNILPFYPITIVWRKKIELKKMHDK